VKRYFSDESQNCAPRVQHFSRDEVLKELNFLNEGAAINGNDVV